MAQVGRVGGVGARGVEHMTAVSVCRLAHVCCTVCEPSFKSSRTVCY